MTKIYRCIIVDDEPMAGAVIKSHLSKIKDFELIGEYDNAVEALQALDENNVDVIFLDIQMPELTGLSMLQLMKKPPLTVLTTAFREFAVEGFEQGVVDYLMKPIAFERFLQTISRLRERSLTDREVAIPKGQEKQEASTDIFIRTNRSFQRIKIEDILHVEAIRNHVKVVLEKEEFTSMIPISEMQKQVPDFFIRVHRSFLVNPYHLKRFNTHFVVNSHAEIPVGRTYREKAIERIKKTLMDTQNGINPDK